MDEAVRTRATVIAGLDSACGHPALTLMPDDAAVLTVELRIDLLAPTNGTV